jgi:pilus assembly protein Flp/PilA
MDNLFKNFLREESGATAIEYALLAALIAVVIISAISALGVELTSTFGTIEKELKAVNTHAATESINKGP